MEYGEVGHMEQVYVATINSASTMNMEKFWKEPFGHSLTQTFPSHIYKHLSCQVKVVKMF